MRDLNPRHCPPMGTLYQAEPMVSVGEEEEGFEPSGPFDPAVFKTAALSRSATLPYYRAPRVSGASTTCGIRAAGPR